MLDSTIATALALQAVRPNDPEAAALTASLMISFTYSLTDGRTFLSAFLRLSFIFDADYALSFLANDLVAERFC
jgi:hypothetical protein